MGVRYLITFASSLEYVCAWPTTTDAEKYPVKLLGATIVWVASCIPCRRRRRRASYSSSSTTATTGREGGGNALLRPRRSDLRASTSIPSRATLAAPRPPYGPVAGAFACEVAKVFFPRERCERRAIDRMNCRRHTAADKRLMTSRAALRCRGRG